MKILISTLGSRGDVQPYLALAVGLKNAGHQPTLAAPVIFSNWIRLFGVEVVAVRFNPQDAMQKLGKGQGGLRTMGTMLKIIREGMKDAQDDVWQAAEDTDFFIQSGTGMGAMEAAAVHRIPGAFGHLFPFASSRAFPMFWLPFRKSLGGGYNMLTHKLMSRVLWQVGGSMTNKWRKRLGLNPWRSESQLFAHARSLNTPFLYGYSTAFLPKPSDWDECQHITGYWILETPQDWQPPAGLLSFLDDGPPPVYIGFGSMSDESSDRKIQLALRALEKTKQRGLLFKGWGSLSGLPQTNMIYCVDDIPHSWLFPRMAAVVHHGGAGTTGAGLRAGIPSILTPFGGDQFAWADQVAKLGVGPRLPGNKKLTAETLAAAINTAVNDKGMQARAAALGIKIRAENGVARVVEIIEQHAANFRSKQHV